MSGVRDSDTLVARRIRALKRGIDKSLMELTEVEVAINARFRFTPAGDGGLERKRLLLMNLITAMDARLGQLQAQPGGCRGKRAFTR
jgi:hypothetical protein